jgi:hypothetical protein
MVGPTDHRRLAFALRSRRVTEGGDVGGCRQLRLAAATTSKRSFSRLVACYRAAPATYAATM